MEAEEISGTGYPRRDITWTSATVQTSVADLIAAQQQAEAENIAAVLRQYAELFEESE